MREPTPQPKMPNKPLIAKLLKDGVVTVPGAHLETRNNLQIK
jgi:hypothetical protein